MRQDELERVISTLRAQAAAMRRDIKTAFRRIDEQTKLTDSVHELALSVRDLANNQEHTRQDVARISRDVDELKGRPGKRWETAVMELVKYAVLAAAGYLAARLF